MHYDRPIEIQFDIEFEPTHAAASAARQTARDRLASLPLPSRVVADLELVIAEVASNAVEQEPDSLVKLTIAVTAAGVLVTVANETTDTTLERRLSKPNDIAAKGEALAERGRGLGIVEALTDELWVDNADGWTSVSCLRYLEPPTR